MNSPSDSQHWVDPSRHQHVEALLVCWEGGEGQELIRLEALYNDSAMQALEKANCSTQLPLTLYGKIEQMAQWSHKPHYAR